MRKVSVFSKLAAVMLAAVMTVSVGTWGNVTVQGAQEKGQYGKLSYDVN